MFCSSIIPFKSENFLNFYVAEKPGILMILSCPDTWPDTWPDTCPDTCPDTWPDNYLK